MKAEKALLFIVTTILLTSCSIEKRQYMPGFYVNWKTEKNTTTPKSHDNCETLTDVANSNVVLDKKDNFPITVSNDTAITIVSLKSSFKNISFIYQQSDTLKPKPKKAAPKKEKKPIDPTKDSKASLLLGILANCLFIFGIALLIFVLYFPEFFFLPYMLGMLSIIAALILVIIGLTKSTKVLHYLKSNPEDTKKNKRKAIIGFVLNMFILSFPLAYLILIIIAMGA